MRVVSLFAALAGAIGSVGLMFSEARNAPRFLLVLFAIWVLSPFVGLVLTHAASARWSGLTRTALYGVMIVIALASLAIYGITAMRPTRPQAAFVFVVVPPASWLLLALIVPIAAWVS